MNAARRLLLAALGIGLVLRVRAALAQTNAWQIGKERRIREGVVEAIPPPRLIARAVKTEQKGNTT